MGLVGRRVGESGSHRGRERSSHLSHLSSDLSLQILRDCKQMPEISMGQVPGECWDEEGLPKILQIPTLIKVMVGSLCPPRQSKSLASF